MNLFARPFVLSLSALALGVVLPAAFVAGCAAEAAPESAEAVGTDSAELSRCGARPRTRAGCTARCECSGPVTGPFGETPEDYACTPGAGGGLADCRLRVPRPDCFWEVTCR